MNPPAIAARIVRALVDLFGPDILETALRVPVEGSPLADLLGLATELVGGDAVRKLVDDLAAAPYAAADARVDELEDAKFGKEKKP